MMVPVSGLGFGYILVWSRMGTELRGIMVFIIDLFGGLKQHNSGQLKSSLFIYENLKGGRKLCIVAWCVEFMCVKNAESFTPLYCASWPLNDPWVEVTASACSPLTAVQGSKLLKTWGAAAGPLCCVSKSWRNSSQHLFYTSLYTQVYPLPQNEISTFQCVMGWLNCYSLQNTVHVYRPSFWISTRGDILPKLTPLLRDSLSFVLPPPPPSERLLISCTHSRQAMQEWKTRKNSYCYYNNSLSTHEQPDEVAVDPKIQ